MKILTIIPAKLDSKRLPHKNITLLKGKPMLLHSIDYAKQSKYNNTIIVSSEEDFIKDLLPKDVIFHKRSKELCGDVEVVDVYLNIIDNLKDKFDYVVCLQPDNPNRSNTLDKCLNYMIDNNYDDLITVNELYKRSGSVRIFKYNELASHKVSKRMGCIKDNATDIHYKKDLESII